MTAFGGKLSDLMRARGLTDEALAAKIPSTRGTGHVSSTYVSRLRRGERLPSPHFLAGLDRVLGGDAALELRQAAATDRTPATVRAELERLRTEPRKPRESAVDMASRVGRYGSDAYYQAGLWIRPPRREDTEDCLFQAAVIVEALNIRNWRAALLKAVRAVIPPDALAAAEANLRTNLADQASARAAFEGEMLRSDIPVEEVTSREWVLLECRSPKCPHPGHRFFEDAAGPVEAAHCPLNGDPETHPEVDLRAIARARFQPTHAEGA